MCDKYQYRGCDIHKNTCNNFGSNYYTAINNRVRDSDGNIAHAHSGSESQIKRIIDCYKKMQNGGAYWKYHKSIRNKALKLSGRNIIYKN